MKRLTSLAWAICHPLQWWRAAFGYNQFSYSRTAVGYSESEFERAHLSEAMIGDVQDILRSV